MNFKAEIGGSTPASAFSFSFIRRRGRVMWVRALQAFFSFSDIDVGDAFQFINQVSGVSPPASALSFSHVDVGDAFHFINHIAERRNRNVGQFIGGSPTSEKY